MVHDEDLGAATQGTGGALSEELVYEGAPPLDRVPLTPERVPQLLQRPVEEQHPTR